jgi:hypothetical protein
MSKQKEIKVGDIVKYNAHSYYRRTNSYGIVIEQEIVTQYRIEQDQYKEWQWYKVQWFNSPVGLEPIDWHFCKDIKKASIK